MKETKNNRGGGPQKKVFSKTKNIKMFFTSTNTKFFGGKSNGCYVSSTTNID